MPILSEAWPDTLKDKAVIEKYKTYLQLSNATNPTHPDEADEEAFAKLFTPDGTYQLGPRSATGHDGTQTLCYPDLPTLLSQMYDN